uniref:Uncharacterized protein n=1 Tax=Anopheles dirus TaxID=7168 RepID=A0A182NRZ5_9DIPT
MAFKFVIFAAVVAVARAGLIASPAVTYAAAPAVVAAPVAKAHLDHRVGFDARVCTPNGPYLIECRGGLATMSAPAVTSSVTACPVSIEQISP